MSYQVLARKLRPASFAALVGQDHVVRALRHALDHNRLHHAYLFTGTRGVGKTTVARILAKCLNCEEGVSATPCGKCSVCEAVAENRFIDLIEVDAASRTRVDDTRDLLDNAQYLPTQGRYKVYLIDEVHMLSTASFNALLKTLEEPPEHVKFLLATTDPKKVPLTVLSRCLQFQLKLIPPERVAAYLSDVLSTEEIDFEPAALEVIGRAARGSMRDALSITDQAIAFGQGRLGHADVVDMLGVVAGDQVGTIVDGLARGDAQALLATVAELAERAVDFDSLLSELLAEFHRMAVVLATGGSLASADVAEVDLAAFYAPETVQLLYQIGLMGYRDLQISPDPRSGVEMTLLRMLAFAPESVPTSVPRLDRQATQTERELPEQSVETRAEQPRNSGKAAREPRRVDGKASWHEIVAALDLAGVARMIAEHSNLVEQHDGVVGLVLDRAHDTLLNDTHIRTITRALEAYFGNKLELRIEPGETSEETPASRTQRIGEERLRDAERMLQTDTMVKSLLDDFDGKLDDVIAVDQAGR